MSADDLINGGPPTGDYDQEDTPYLGVPKGYQFPERRPRMPATFGLGPERMGPAFEPYRKGDEFGPSTLAVEDRAKLQLALREAGLYTKSERFQLGVWDANTRTAYKRLLEYANGAGLPWQQALNEYSAVKAQMGDTAGTARAPLVTKVTSAADLRKVFDNTARSTIGRRLDASEIDRLIAAYQAEERREQTAAYNLDETGGAMTAAPDPTVFAAEQAQALDPAGKQELDLLSINDTLMGALKGIGG